MNSELRQRIHAEAEATGPLRPPDLDQLRRTGRTRERRKWTAAVAASTAVAACAAVPIVALWSGHSVDRAGNDALAGNDAKAFELDCKEFGVSLFGDGLMEVAPNEQVKSVSDMEAFARAHTDVSPPSRVVSEEMEPGIFKVAIIDSLGSTMAVAYFARGSGGGWTAQSIQECTADSAQ